MSLSTWVQLFRNFFCVCKSLLPSNNLFQKVFFPSSSFYPLTLTTGIELFIAPTQFAAVIFNVISGYQKLDVFYPKLHRYQQWMYALDRWFISNTAQAVTVGPAYCIMKQGLQHDLSDARVNVIVGIFEIIFGIAFLFLVMNSLHIVGPTHPKPLIDALIAMEIGLAYILVLMWKAYMNKCNDATRLMKLAKAIASLSPPLTPTSVCVNLMKAGYEQGDLFQAIGSLGCFSDASDAYVPSWRSTSESKSATDSPTADEIQKEITNVTNIVGKISSNAPEGSITRKLYATALQKKASEASFQAPIELVYFILNFIAGYGYLLGILAFYVAETADNWSLCKICMFGMSHADADWWGNLAGDVAWTIEPLLVLINQPLISYWTKNKEKMEAKNK